MIYLISKILLFIAAALGLGWWLGSAWYRQKLRQSTQQYAQLHAELETASQTQQDLLLSKERGLMEEHHRRRELETLLEASIEARAQAEQRLLALEDSFELESRDVQVFEQELRNLRETHQKTVARLRELEEAGTAAPDHGLQAAVTRLELQLAESSARVAGLESELRVVRGRAEKAETERLDLRVHIESALQERDELQRRIRLLEEGGKVRTLHVPAPLQAPLPTPLPVTQVTAPLAGRLQPLQSSAILFDERPGRVDDLTQIAGIGRKLEKLLNGLGIYQLEQLATLSPEQICWVDEKLSFRGRIHRENWVGQAGAMLAARSLPAGAEAAIERGMERGDFN